MRFSIEWWVSRLAVSRSYVAACCATATSTLRDPSNLFIAVVMEWKYAAFLHRPFYEGRLRAAQILPLYQR